MQCLSFLSFKYLARRLVLGTLMSEGSTQRVMFRMFRMTANRFVTVSAIYSWSDDQIEWARSVLCSCFTLPRPFHKFIQLDLKGKPLLFVCNSFVILSCSMALFTTDDIVFLLSSKQQHNDRWWRVGASGKELRWGQNGPSDQIGKVRKRILCKFCLTRSILNHC
jgi:phosphoribosylformylglycinamidine (FGAM) synthase-like amidotransferase family enzyme